MHIPTPITKKKLLNHLTYAGWKYLLLIACAIFGWGLIYTVTLPRVPQEKRVDLHVISYTAISDQVDAFLKPLWEETVPEMDSVVSTVVAPDANYGNMQLTAYFAAADVDIILLNETYFKSFASNGSFIPLEDYIADGTIDVGDIDLKNGYVAYIESYDEQNRPKVGERRLYGIPLDSFYGFMEGMNIDNRGMFAAIAINNLNDENVIPFFNALLNAGRGEMPAALASGAEQ